MATVTAVRGTHAPYLHSQRPSTSARSGAMAIVDAIPLAPQLQRQPQLQQQQQQQQEKQLPLQPAGRTHNHDFSLQKYLLLHWQHEALTLQFRRASILDSPHHQAEPRQSDAERRCLMRVNEGIKRELTELLNCDVVRDNVTLRSFVQSRLMDAERELRLGRKRRRPSGSSSPPS